MSRALRSLVRDAPGVIEVRRLGDAELLAVAEVLGEREWPSQEHRALGGWVMMETAHRDPRAYDECVGDLGTGLVAGNYPDVMLVEQMPRVAAFLRDVVEAQP